MSDCIHLIGADAVQSGAYAMGEAADEMRRAAAEFAQTAEAMRSHLDEWLGRLEALLRQEKERI